MMATLYAGTMPDHSSLITDTGYATISNTTKVSMAPHCRVYVSSLPHAHVGSRTGRGFTFTCASMVITWPDQSFSHSHCTGPGALEPLGQLPDLVHRVLLEHGDACSRYTLCFHTTTAELSRCSRDCRTQELKIRLHCLVLQEKAHRPRNGSQQVTQPHLTLKQENVTLLLSQKTELELLGGQHCCLS